MAVMWMSISSENLCIILHLYFKELYWSVTFNRGLSYWKNLLTEIFFVGFNFMLTFNMKFKSWISTRLSLQQSSKQVIWLWKHQLNSEKYIWVAVFFTMQGLVQFSVWLYFFISIDMQIDILRIIENNRAKS